MLLQPVPMATILFLEEPYSKRLTCTRELTIYHHSDTVELVINSVSITAWYLRIVDSHTALIICTGITWLCILDGEGKVVMQFILWQNIIESGDWHTIFCPPNTVISAQFSRHYLTVNGGW